MASPRMLIAAMKNYRRVLPLMRDERVPMPLKASAVALALLIISPLDIFADIPVLGFVDDAVLLTVLAMLFVSVAGRLTQKDVTPRNVTQHAPRVP